MRTIKIVTRRTVKTIIIYSIGAMIAKLSVILALNLMTNVKRSLYYTHSVITQSFVFTIWLFSAFSPNFNLLLAFSFVLIYIYVTIEPCMTFIIEWAIITSLFTFTKLQIFVWVKYEAPSWSTFFIWVTSFPWISCWGLIINDLQSSDLMLMMLMSFGFFQ